MNKPLVNLLDAGEAITNHILLIRGVRNDLGGWAGANPERRRTLLMELRHDLEDALKHVRELESDEQSLTLRKTLVPPA